MRRYRLRSIYTLFLASYLIILILPAVLAGWMCHEALLSAQEKYAESESGELARSAAYFERYLEQLDSTSAKLAYDTDLQQIAKMKRPEPGESDVVQVVKFNNRIKDMLSAEQDSTYVVLLRENEFIFTNTSIIYGLDFFYNKSRTYQGMSSEEWQSVSFGAHQRVFLPMQDITWMGKTTRAITYNYPIGGGKRQDVWGAIQYLIPLSDLELIFEDVFLNGSGEVLIYNEQNFIGSIGVDYGQEFTADQFVGKQGQLESKGSKTVALYHKIDQGLTFVVNMPQSEAYRDAYQLSSMSYIAAFCCILIEVGLGCYFAWRYSAPLKNILNNIKMLTGSGEVNKNEYHQLANGVELLIQKNQNMQTALASQQEREKRSVIDQILKGWIQDEEGIRRAAWQAGLNVRAEEHRIVILEGTEINRKIEQLQEKEQIYISWINEVKPERYVMMLGILDPLGNDSVKEWLRMDPVYRAGVGRAYRSLCDLTFSYYQAQYVLERTGRSDPPILWYEELPKENQEAFFPLELEERLFKSVKYGEEAGVEDIFRILQKENVQKRNLSPVMGRLLQADLTAAYLKIGKDVICDKQWVEQEESLLRELPIDQMLPILKERFLTLCCEVRQSQRDKKEDVRRRLVQYLEEHFSESQLCVARMAEEFGFSETYFSQFFKEASGDSFSMRLEQIRMEHAKTYLRGTQYDVETIAQMCGYTNSGSFRRAFKRFCGVSPSTWRQENR